MADDTPAKVWSDQRDLPIYLGDSGDGFRLPFKENWRPPDAIAALIGFVVTASLVTFNLQSGNALTILVAGVIADRGRGARPVQAARHQALAGHPADTCGWPTCDPR